MIKSILLSNRSKYSHLIMIGEKKYEVRKSKLPQGVPIYNYVTKAKPIIWEFSEFVKHLGHRKFWNGEHYSHDNLSEKAVILNGTIPFRFKVGEIKEIPQNQIEWFYDDSELLVKSCLTSEEVLDYSNDKPLYFHEIIDLEIFDVPMQLSDFSILRDEIIYNKHGFPFKSGKSKYYKLTKAPQSYQYVWVKES